MFNVQRSVLLQLEIAKVAFVSSSTTESVVNYGLNLDNLSSVLRNMNPGLATRLQFDREMLLLQSDNGISFELPILDLDAECVNICNASASIKITQPHAFATAICQMAHMGTENLTVEVTDKEVILSVQATLCGIDGRVAFRHSDNQCTTGTSTLAFQNIIPFFDHMSQLTCVTLCVSHWANIMNFTLNNHTQTATLNLFVAIIAPE